MVRMLRTITALLFIAAMLTAGCDGYTKEPGLLETTGILPRAEEPDQAQRPAQLRVMTFNIRYGTADDGDNAWPKRRELLFDVIRANDPDIIGLQEALRFQLDDLHAALPQYSEIGVGRDDGKTRGEYAAILYRTDRFVVSPDDSGTFWLSDTPETPGSKSWGNTIPRICTWARLRERGGVPGGGDASTPIDIYNVHLDHQSERSRQMSVQLLLSRITRRAYANETIIVTGDFNCGESSAGIRAMQAADEHNHIAPGTSGWPALVDSFRVVHPKGSDIDVGTFHAFKGTTDGDKIDYIFVPHFTSVRSAEIDHTSRDGRYPSDHFPVTATIQLR